MSDVNLKSGLRAKTLPVNYRRLESYGEFRSKKQGQLVASTPLYKQKFAHVPLGDQEGEEAFFVPTLEAAAEHNRTPRQSAQVDEPTYVFIPAETELEILPGCSYDQLMNTLNSILAQNAVSYTTFKINDVMQKWGIWSASKQKAAIEMICKILKKFPQITDLEMQHNKMDAKVGTYLIEQLSAHKINLQRLDLGGNELGKYMVVSTDVSKFLQNLGMYVGHTHIESVCLSRNSFKAKDSTQVMNEMGHALSIRPPFQALAVSLDGNDLIADGTQRADLVKRIYETTSNFPKWSVQLNNCKGLTKCASSFLTAASSFQSRLINCESTKDREQLYQKLNERFFSYFKETFLEITKILAKGKNSEVEQLFDRCFALIHDGDGNLPSIMSALEDLRFKLRPRELSAHLKVYHLCSELIDSIRVYRLADANANLRVTRATKSSSYIDLAPPSPLVDLHRVS